MKRKSMMLVAAGLGMMLILACATAQGAIIAGQDDDIDFLFTAQTSGGVTTLVPKTTGSFAVGDILVSIFELPSLTYDGGSVIPAGFEATGVAVIQLTGGSGTVLDPYTFAPYTGGFNFVSPVDVANGDATQGAMIAIWLNDSNIDLQLDFAQNVTTNCTSFAQCIGEATEGTLLQVDGFAGDLDQFWTSIITVANGDNVATVAGVSGSNGVADFNAALTTFVNNIPTAGFPILFQDILSGDPCPAGTTGLDGCIAGPTLSGGISGGNGLYSGLYTDGAFARSDIDSAKLAEVIPEPATLMLMGIGLLGLAATLRRKR